MMKFTKIALTVVLAVSVTFIIVVRWYLISLLPTVEGIVLTDKVTQPVTIDRDKWGVPHIEAQNGRDAYFSLGYTIAQDRLFQMDIQRRAARGELAEILGESVVDVDRMYRTLMIRHRSEEYLSDEAAINPTALAYLDAFLDGINHFISIEPTPVEYKIINAEPRKFTRLDSIAAMGFVAFSFADAIKRDALYSQFSTVISASDLAILFPRYADRNKSTIMEPDGAFSAITVLHGVSRSGRNFITPEKHGALSVQSDGNKQNDIHKLVSAVDRLTLLSSEVVPEFTGSNSWILGPERSENGEALLANDPHVGISNPGVWYEAHVKYPGYENYGYHLPLMPFPLLGHNRDKAWALTMLENDDMDLYSETIHPQNSEFVLSKGEWVNLKEVRELIKVKGQKPEDITVRVTPHGPVISDFIKGYSGAPVSLNWVYHKVNTPILDVLYGIGVANTVEAFRESVAQLAAPGLNISYIDKQGNIGWWAAGRLPIRPGNTSGKDIHEGGSGNHDWLGYLPFEKNPQLVNPESGIIVTANNQPTAHMISPLGEVTGYFRPDDRAARIYELIQKKERWSLREFKAVQSDIMLAEGLGIARVMSQSLELRRSRFSENEVTALDYLVEWDGEAGLDSVGVTVFQFTLYHFMKELLEERVGDDSFKQYLNLFDYWNFLKALDIGRDYSEPDAKGSLFERDLEDLLESAFKAAVAEMISRLGNNSHDWHWGNVHSIEFVHSLGRHPVLAKVFNLGPFASEGEFPAINKLKSKIGEHDYKVKSIPSTRRLISMNPETASWSVLPTGNSGNLMSRFYNDQINLYLENDYRKIIFSPEEISEGSIHRLTISPASNK